MVEGCAEVFAEGRGGTPRFVVIIDAAEDDEDDADATRRGGCFSCLLGFLYTPLPLPLLPPPAAATALLALLVWLSTLLLVLVFPLP